MNDNMFFPDEEIHDTKFRAYHHYYGDFFTYSDRNVHHVLL